MEESTNWQTVYLAVFSQHTPFVLSIKFCTYESNWQYDNIRLRSRVTHICVSKLTIIGSDSGLLLVRRRAIIWTNAGILFIGSLGINFSEIFIESICFIQHYAFEDVVRKLAEVLSRPEFVKVCLIRDNFIWPVVMLHSISYSSYFEPSANLPNNKNIFMWPCNTCW